MGGQFQLKATALSLTCITTAVRLEVWTKHCWSTQPAQEARLNIWIIMSRWYSSSSVRSPAARRLTWTSVQSVKWEAKWIGSLWHTTDCVCVCWNELFSEGGFGRLQLSQLERCLVEHKLFLSVLIGLLSRADRGPPRPNLTHWGTDWLTAEHLNSGLQFCYPCR